jgi:hypothetical protein
MLRLAARHADVVGLLPAPITSSPDELIRERGWTGIDAETVWEMPTIFIGSPAQIRDDLMARRARFGLSYLVVSESTLPALAEIIGAL